MFSHFYEKYDLNIIVIMSNNGLNSNIYIMDSDQVKLCRLTVLVKLVQAS